MLLKGGYTQRLLEINLSSGDIKTRGVDPSWSIKWIGGRGWGARILWEKLVQNPKLDPLGPENVVTIAPGPLTGLLLPSSGKTHIAAISPATGIYGDTNMGGEFGAEIKFAGYDALVLRGRSDKPTYLCVDDDEVELRSAGDYWGKGSLEAEEALKKDLGDEFSVATIGPAGEKLSAIACITTNYGRNAGRTGMGAVLGSKNVKAVAVRGTKDIPVADTERLFNLAQEAWRWILQNHYRKIYHQQGTMIMVDIANETGILPTRNFTDSHFDHASDLSGDMLGDFRKISKSCSFCPMFCGQFCVIKSGKYKGFAIEGPEYETATMLGAVTGIHDLSTIIYGNYLCDELGIDTISAGNLTGLAMEMYKHGIITGKDSGGLELEFGRDESLIEFIKMIGHRTGIGEVFSNGVKSVLKKWPSASRFAMQNKGLEQSAYDTRASLDMALAYATCDIGAHHNRAWTIGKLHPQATSDERARLVIYHQHLRPLFDSLGVCRFPWIELRYPEDNYAAFYSAATGIETTLGHLLARSEGVFNLTRAINVVRGMSKKDDYPPERVFKDAVQSGLNKGAKLTRDAYESLLRTYYEQRGWNPENGIPTKEKLEELGMSDVADHALPWTLFAPHPRRNT